MKRLVQNQIYIGYNDSQTMGEFVSRDELVKTVSLFFERQCIAFSIVDADGGYICKEYNFVSERTLIITIIGDQNLDIIKLSKALSMFMNQDCLMITRTFKDVEFA